MDEEVERWVELYEFPLYEISSFGRIKNRLSGVILKVAQNKNGVAMVGLRTEGRTYIRGVAKLVATEFLEEIETPPQMDPWNTVIHLDHDRMNCRASNLYWRPRWWAVRWEREWKQGPRYSERIMHRPTAAIFESAWHAAHQYGLLEEVLYSKAKQHYYDNSCPSDWIFYVE